MYVRSAASLTQPFQRKQDLIATFSLARALISLQPGPSVLALLGSGWRGRQRQSCERLCLFLCHNSGVCSYPHIMKGIQTYTRRSSGHLGSLLPRTSDPIQEWRMRIHFLTYKLRTSVFASSPESLEEVEKLWGSSVHTELPLTLFPTTPSPLLDLPSFGTFISPCKYISGLEAFFCLFLFRQIKMSFWFAQNKLLPAQEQKKLIRS